METDHTNGTRVPGPKLLIAIFFFMGLVGCEGAAQNDDARSSDAGIDIDTVAFVGVSVVPMDEEGILENQTVLVEEGHISNMGPTASLAVPDGARVIEGQGLWLIPGLAEMHAHIPGPSTSQEALEDLLFLYLANGVTTIRGMAGAPNHLQLREAVASGDLLGPTIFAGAPSLNGNTAPDTTTAESLVRAHADAGYDLLKLHPGLSREVYDRIVATAEDVGITWAGHVSPAVGLEHALATGKSTIEHLDGYVEATASVEIRERSLQGEAVPLREVLQSITPRRIQQLAHTTAAAGTWIVPTMYLWENFYNDTPAADLAALPEMRYATSDQLAEWTERKESRFFVNLLEGWRTDGELGADDVAQDDAEALIQVRRDILAALDAADAPILMGTDSPQVFMVPGFSLHHEIRVMSESGLSPYRILRSGTRNVGRYAVEDLGVERSFGTVTVGSTADLVLLEQNPLEHLETLRTPAGVMVRGNWLPAEALREGLEDIAARIGSKRGDEAGSP